MARKPPPDWEAIEKLYRTGALSNRQIAEKFECTEGAVRDRAKRYLWKRDLKEPVAQATAQKLLRDQLRTAQRAGYEPSEKELIESASDMQAGRVIMHRTGVGSAITLSLSMLQRLGESFAQHDEIVEDIETFTEGDENPRRRQRMLAAVELPAQIVALKDWASGFKFLVAIDRQAYGLSDKVADKPPEDPRNDEETARQIRYVHEMLTRGPMARPGGPLPVIDQPAPARVTNGAGNGALNGKGHK